MQTGRQTDHSAKPSKQKASQASIKEGPNNKAMITATMNVLDIIDLHPNAADILSAYGLHCVGCAFNTMDSLEDGARAHGLTDVDIENILIDLNDLLAGGAMKTQPLILTESAAKALQKIAHDEKREECHLRIIADEYGKFCLEFAEKKEQDEEEFIHPTIQSVALLAGHATLVRIGGSTVDYREGRFKLDLAQKCHCKKDDCSCKTS